MTTPKIIAPKKLIEVALPLDDINRACAKEKSIRHGHPSTLHLWWARRPLAAARAVLFAQLVNDPSWKYSDEDLKKPAIRGAVTRKRNELFRLISEFVLWENTNDARILERARAEIRASWRETCEANKGHPDAKTLFDPDNQPPFHDPFAGGGALPLEAQRLGLESHATDLNPVAVLINKAMIEIPPRFMGRPPVGRVEAAERQIKATATEDWSGAKGLAEDVRRYSRWMRDEAERRIGHLYPRVLITRELANSRADLKPLEGRELTVIAWLWARTVKSPSPAFANVDVPLASTFMLSTKAGQEAYVDPIIEDGAYRFTVRVGKPTGGRAERGTKLARGANFQCLMSNAPITGDYIKAEGKAGRMGARLMAIVVEGDRKRIYLPPTEMMEAAARQAKPEWKPDVVISGSTQYLGVKPYGMEKFSELFTDRQLVALTTFSDLAQEARDRVRADAIAAGIVDDDKPLHAGGSGATAYADAVSIYLAFAVSKAADRNSSLCFWESPMNRLRGTFGRQVLPMVWDYAETNPFAGAGGDIYGTAQSLCEVLDNFSNSGKALVEQHDASTQTVSRQKVVSTDPPYYDNVPYADLSDFFYVWLRRSLARVMPELFATLTTPKASELVAFAYRHSGKSGADAFFLEGMTQAMTRIAEEAHPSFPVTIYYAFKQSDEDDQNGTSSTGWETFLSAVFRAGLAITGTWPMRTELTVAIKKNLSALASSIVLVCRSRPADSEGAGTTARRDFLRELDRALPSAIAEMTADPVAAIAPVDLAQACIGPGMAIYSKHSAVLEADGSPMSVHNALVHINKAVDEYFAHAEGELDADSRFCIGWFEQRGFEEGPFGEADVLARAKGTSVDGVKEAGVVAVTRGKVRLFTIKEFPEAWDPTQDTRVPTWEALHNLVRALGESEGDAGALLAKMQARQDDIRQLAYRLYTLCERKGWVEHARAYNDLITSWPEIVKASQQTAPRGQIELV